MTEKIIPCPKEKYSTYLAVAADIFNNSSWNGVKPNLEVEETNLKNLFLAYEDSNLLGFFSINKEPYLDCESIALLGVSSSHRKKGIGSKLLKQAEQILKQRKIEKSIITFPAFCEDLFRFYSKNGYYIQRIKFEAKLEDGSHMKHLSWKDFSKLTKIVWVIPWAEFAKQLA